jgi:hypothetical protein
MAQIPKKKNQLKKTIKDFSLDVKKKQKMSLKE